MPLPNLIVAGFAKCGTTSLYHYLAQHPDIFMSPIKEPNYFWYATYSAQEIAYFKKMRTTQGLRIPQRHVSRAGYEALFAAGAHHKIRGEASTCYTKYYKAIPTIRDIVPQARIIVLMREPVARTISEYNYWRKRGAMLQADVGRHTSFQEVLERELDPTPEIDPYLLEHNITPYVRCIRRYDEAVAHLRRCFPAKQLLLLRAEDLIAHPQAAMHRVFSFLGVDPGIVAKSDFVYRHNTSNEQRVDRYYYKIKALSLREVLARAQLYLRRNPRRLLPRVYRHIHYHWTHRIRPVPTYRPTPKERHILREYYSSRCTEFYGYNIPSSGT